MSLFLAFVLFGMLYHLLVGNYIDVCAGARAGRVKM